MAVQKSKVTRSRRGQRRSHDSLKAKTLSFDPVSGEKHLRHQGVRPLTNIWPEIIFYKK